MNDKIIAAYDILCLLQRAGLLNTMITLQNTNQIGSQVYLNSRLWATAPEEIEGKNTAELRNELGSLMGLC